MEVLFATFLVPVFPTGLSAQAPDPGEGAVSASKQASSVLLPVKASPAGMNIPAFYAKYVEAEGYPIVGTVGALQRGTAWTVGLPAPDLRVHSVQ